MENEEVSSPSMEETLKASYDKIFGGVGKGDNVPAPEKAVDGVAAEAGDDGVPGQDNLDNPDGRARDENGRFVKAEKAAETPEKPAPAVEEKPEAPKKAAFVPKWQKQALEKWALLDPTIKAEVEKREQDFHKGIEQYKTDAQMAREFKEALSPYMATIQSTGLPAHAAVAQLLNADHTLRYGSPQQKQAALQSLSTYYGIPLGQQANQPEQPQMPPEVNALYQRIAQLEQGINQQQTAAQMAEQASLSTQIEKFASDPSRAEYFERLRPTMAAILRSGLADGLESAYELAFKNDPVTQSLWLAKQREDWVKESRAKVDAAKKAASVNVSQKGTIHSGAQGGTINETVANLARELGLAS